MLTNFSRDAATDCNKERLYFVLLRTLTRVAPSLFQELTSLAATSSVVFEGLPTGPCLLVFVAVAFMVTLSQAISMCLLHPDVVQVVVSGHLYIEMPIIFYYRYPLISSLYYNQVIILI